ncbi:SUN domain-containing ossification factor [Sinocyclocheilus anshuiensis]|uniref:SUN domain-containing ossification factor n=1 Tax=Sinocyclocheilus anshuiensis TaxID=1608454 RepID=UPI0007B7E85B|nr:PREDICTED: SUN domain-containing ossification factor-like [Sinocyclocheilus anshuiensis]
MKTPLLLLCSVSGLCYWFPVQQGHCSEQTHTLTTRAVSHQPVIDGSDEHYIFISDVESSSVSSRITHITPVSAAPHVCGSSECVSCRDCTASDSCSAESGTTDACTAACDAAENLRYDPQLSSFPAVQESVGVHESRKPTKDQTGNRTNASHILKDQGSSGSADSDPSVPCREQEIPTFEEWTKIMLEVENEKNQITHLSDGPLAAGKKLQQTITNYASVECGAKILSSNPEAKSTSAILMENMDMYMLNPCNNKIWFIIELCQPIQVKQLDIANFEIFSSNPKDFLVSISDRYPNKKWVKLGTFHARDERTVQSFPLDEHLFAKYIKVELLSHFGSEHFCPLSLIRVFGTSMMEEYEMNSEPSDRQTHVQDEHDYDQPPDFVPVDEKSSKNLIGSAKDALLTMVNNIAASVLGGPPETTAGKASTEGLNMTEVVFPPGSIHTAASTGGSFWETFCRTHVSMIFSPWNANFTRGTPPKRIYKLVKWVISAEVLWSSSLCLHRFIIELCQPIQVKQLDIANFEIFSSNPKDFLVSISDRYPNKKWVKLGTFHARDERTVQSFPLDEHLFAKYIKVELLSHFGSEHFCPLSLIRVFGTSMMEEYEMNSEPSDRQTHVQDEHDYDQPPDFVPVDEKSSKNLIGSAKDALLTMVNNIAASVLGGPPETTAGKASTEGLNMTEVVFPPGSIHTAASTGPLTVAADPLDVVGITETASITQETAAARTPPLTDAAGDAPVQTTPDVEQIVTLLPDAEDEPDRSSGRITDESETDHVNENTVHSESSCSHSHRVSLQEHLLQRCSSPDFIQKRKPSSRSHAALAVMTPAISTVTEEPESPVIHARDLAPSLTSDLLRLVSADSLSSRATQPIELMCPSATECLTATVPQQSTDGLSESSEKPNPETLSDIMTTSAALRRDQVARELLSVSSEQVSLENDISTPTVSMNTADESQLSSVSALVDEPAVPGGALMPDHPVHPSDGFTGSAESKRKELFDDESSAHIEQIYTETQNSSDVHAHGSNQKESVFMRLNNRIKVLEMNMSLSGRYLEQLSQRYRKQVEEMQKAFNKTIIKLQNTSRMAEEQDQRQTDSIQALQAQLENMTQLVLRLSVSVSRLQREVSDRQSYILLCLLLCVLLWLLICVNYRQISESPAVDSQRSCCPERELSNDEPVLLRCRASDPPSLSSLQTPDGGSGETNSFKQWEDCQVSRKKKHKVKLSKGPETLAAPPLADGIPQTTIGPLGLETGPRPDGRDVMSDGSSEGSSQADEALFCGITTCSHLCEALPAPKRWTQSRSQHQRGSRRSQHHQQPPQCSGPPPGLGPARNRL